MTREILFFEKTENGNKNTKKVVKHVVNSISEAMDLLKNNNSENFIIWCSETKNGNKLIRKINITD